MRKFKNRILAFSAGLLMSSCLVFAGLETGTYISDLVATNPTGSDSASTADDHLRLIKSTIKTTFPNISGAVTPTHTELNYVDGVTSAIQTQLDAKLAKASNLSDLASTSTARTNLGVTATGSDTTYNYRANNLSDVASVSTARSNLGVTATGIDTTYAYRSNNLSDLSNAATARSNLGVTATGSDTTYAYRANNLSDLANAATARTNLGLGTAATQASSAFAAASHTHAGSDITSAVSASVLPVKFAAARGADTGGACTVNSGSYNVSGCTYNSTGNVTFTFSTAFSANPSCTAVAADSSGTVMFVQIALASTTAVTVQERNTSGTAANSLGFSVTCIGN